jgi:predicted RNA binding protein YcfA (HicA-like mRNA interferase family)
MVSEEVTRTVIKRLKAAGFTLVSTDGRHAKWRHPSGAWVPLPQSHKTISPAVVRKVNRAIEQSKEKRP